MATRDLRPDIGAALAAFGVPAVVTTPDRTAVSTTCIWLPPAEDPQPVGVDFRRAEPRRVAGLPRADVPSAPKGTRIDAPEVLNGPILHWVVDSLQQAVVADELRVVVKQVEF